VSIAARPIRKTTFNLQLERLVDQRLFVMWQLGML
jgi:hypothetical protein